MTCPVDQNPTGHVVVGRISEALLLRRPSSLSRGQQCALDGIRFPFEHAEKACGRAADPTRSLFPLPITGKAHAHQRCHLRLCELCLLADLTWRYGDVDEGGAFPLCMG